MSLCTQSEWFAANGKYRDWYLENYPWLKQFPPNMNDLRDFYIDDMNFRNLAPLDVFKNCYEFLFSYALENMPRVADEKRFKGQTWIQRLVKDQWTDESILWLSLKKTASQITNVANWVMPLVVLALLFWVVKK